MPKLRTGLGKENAGSNVTEKSKYSSKARGVEAISRPVVTTSSKTARISYAAGKTVDARKPSRGSTAATFLAKSADGLSSSPKKSDGITSAKVSNLLGNRNAPRSPRKQLGTLTKLSKTANDKDGFAAPLKPVEKSAPVSLKPSVVLVNSNLTSSSKKHLDVDKKLVKSVDILIKKKKTNVDSPSFSKIPQDIVKNLVDNIQVSQERLEDNLKTPENKGNVKGHQRKKLQMTGRKSMAKGDEGEALEDFSVTVAVRIRPLSTREIEMGARLAISVQGNQVMVKDSAGVDHSFVYDHSFWSVDKANGDFASQEMVYGKLVHPILGASLHGYNTCLFAYGQTGSGKSYTIMGLHEDKGVIPRFCFDIFDQLQQKASETMKFHIQVSYFEIYNEKIHDLLVSGTANTAEENSAKQVLKVREHPEMGPYVEGLSKFSITSYNDALSWLEVGNRQRATAATGMNDKSSRSHSVFTLTLVQSLTEELEGESHESSKTSRINLVDLAGSERSSTAATTGVRFKEGASINKSLLTLGKVISALSDRSDATAIKRRKQPRVFVPYRDSSLTWILKESLGGNSRTAMIATVSPADCHLEETLSTLRYAKQASNIVNLVRVNEDPNAKLIRELKAEVAKLKESCKHPEVDPKQFKASLQEVSLLRQRLCAAEREKEEAQEEWKRRLMQSEKHKTDEINELKRAGVSFKVDNQLPNLVNLNEDPQLSELLLYMIKHGVTKVGKKGSACDIQLNGALVADFHCVLSNRNEVVSIRPNTDASVYINGELIAKEVVLHHGDRVIIGGDHFFRFNNPIEVVSSKSNKRSSSDGTRDFEFAKHEFIERQNAKMQEEIEAAQLRIKQEMLQEIEAAKKEAEKQILMQKSEYETAILSLQTKLIKEEKTKQELEVIREEKDVLEKEVTVARKNREIEAKMFSDKNKVSCKTDEIKTQVLADLEAERIKLAKEVERMQKKSKSGFEGDRRTTMNKVEDSPLRISLLVREANNISKGLKKHTVFSHYDQGDQGDNTIRVKNTKLGIWTLWSSSKFEDRLEMMRDLYSNGGSGEDEDSDHIFYDPNDDWQEAFQSDELPETPTSSRSTSRKLTRRLSSLVLARASPALQQSLNRLTEDGGSPGNRSSTLDSAFITGVCKKRIEACSRTLMTSQSHVDKLLLTLEEFYKTAITIKSSFAEKDDFYRLPLFHEMAVAITFHTEHLMTSVGYVKHHCLEVGATSASVSRLLRQLEKSLRKLAGLVAKLLQGCQQDIESLVSDSLHKLQHLVPNISKYLGALSVATNMEVTIFEEESQHKIGHRLKHAFLQGGDTFMRKVMSGAVDKLAPLSGSSEHPMVNDLSGAVADLLKKCLDLQEESEICQVREVLNRAMSVSRIMNEVYESSLIVQESDVCSKYYEEYLQQTRSLSQEVGLLVEGVSRLNSNDFSTETVPAQELRYKSELLWRPISRIASLCKKHFIANNTSEGRTQNPNFNNNSNQDTCHLDTAYLLLDEVEMKAKKTQEILREIINFADERSRSNSSLVESESDEHQQDENCNELRSMSFRKKRLLPTSPDVLENKDLYSSSFAIKDTVSKWLQLADFSKLDSSVTSTKSVYV